MSSIILRTNIVLLMLVFASALQSCNSSPYKKSTFTKDGNINMVIEIPAGTNVKYEFSLESNEFEVELINGKQRVVEFLGYPGNYGFIPSTLMDKLKGGDGDALDILVISQSLPRGTIMEVVPVGVLSLLDGGETDDKIIAVPADESLRTINCQSLICLQEKYPKVLSIIEEWFTNYKGLGKMTSMGWSDEKKALVEIKKWSIPNEKK